MVRRKIKGKKKVRLVPFFSEGQKVLTGNLQLAEILYPTIQEDNIRYQVAIGNAKYDVDGANLAIFGHGLVGEQINSANLALAALKRHSAYGITFEALVKNIFAHSRAIIRLTNDKEILSRKFKTLQYRFRAILLIGVVSIVGNLFQWLM